MSADPVTCHGCGDAIEPESDVGDFQGTTMHAVCALEHRAMDAEDRLAKLEDVVFNGGYERASLFARRVGGLRS